MRELRHNCRTIDDVPGFLASSYPAHIVIEVRGDHVDPYWGLWTKTPMGVHLDLAVTMMPSRALYVSDAGDLCSESLADAYRSVGFSATAATLFAEHRRRGIDEATVVAAHESDAAN